MKKFLILFALIWAVFIGHAQIPTLLTTVAYGNTLDTVVNTGSVTTTAFKVNTWKTGVTVQAIATKISGTVAGSLGLYGSMDGVKFTLIGSATTPSDASANYGFNTTVRWYYYQVKWTGASTMSASLKVYIEPY